MTIALVLAGYALAAGAPAVSHSPGTFRLERADGSHIVYHVDRRNRRARHGVLLMLQGSGCEPVIERDWVRSEPPVLAPAEAVVTIEKYGVAPGQARHSFVDGCSSQYWAKNTLHQRVLDALQVIARLRTAPWWNGRMIIYGGSEGGAVAAMLAPLVPENNAVVIQSAGIGVTVAELILSAVPPPVAAEMKRVFAEAKSNPTGNKRAGGASYRWWADAADVTPAKILLQTNVPVLLIHGTRDQFAPVAAARATRDLFAAAGKRNLTYREYASYDHSMKDAADGDHRREVLEQAAAWLRSK